MVIKIKYIFKIKTISSVESWDIISKTVDYLYIKQFDGTEYYFKALEITYWVILKESDGE